MLFLSLMRIRRVNSFRLVKGLFGLSHGRLCEVMGQYELVVLEVLQEVCLKKI